MTASPTVTWHCPPQSVLVGVDFGEASARALALASVVAAGFDARLRVLHAERFEPPPYFTVEQIGRLEAERQAAQAAAVSHLTQFANTATAYATEPLVANEPPVEALLREGTTTDLIVLGTHGRHGPGRWWLGSVAERVVRASVVPVLVTRAGVTAPHQVFEHLLLVQEGTGADASVSMCAGLLAGLARGSVTTARPLAACDATALQQASLVMMPTPRQRASWIFSDSVARILGGCERPVLFIPAPSA
jgi:nucleotide-binding universal stress UspA family protein